MTKPQFPYALFFHSTNECVTPFPGVPDSNGWVSEFESLETFLVRHLGKGFENYPMGYKDLVGEVSVPSSDGSWAIFKVYF